MKSSCLKLYCPPLFLSDVATVLEAEKCSTKTQEVALKVFWKILQDCVNRPELKELHAKVERIYKQTIQPFLALQTETLCQQLRNSPGDFTFFCMNGEVSAHKSVLHSLKNPFFVKCEDKITLFEYSTEAVNLCLDLIYQTLDINDIDFEDLLELHKVLHALSLTDFVEKCEKAMEECLKLYERPSLTNWIKDLYVSLPKQIPGWKLDEASKKALFERYKTEADLGDGLAMNNLGYCLEHGNGVDKDEKEAVAWYIKAAELGYPAAMSNLGNCLEDGIGVNKDEKEAVVWYRRAAELGYSIAMNNLGYCLEHGNGVDKDEKEAVAWYRRAAELGYSIAMSNLGNCLEDGIGVNKDEKEAVVWCRRAAELGNSIAMNNLGYYLQLGIGIDKDEKEAVVWYTRAAELGDSDAMHNLGVCHLDGIGVDKNKIQALSWFTKAANLGDDEAREALNNLIVELA